MDCYGIIVVLWVVGICVVLVVVVVFVCCLMEICVCVVL